MLVWNASDFDGKSWIQFKRVGMHQYIWTPQVRLLKYTHTHSKIDTNTPLFNLKSIVRLFFVVEKIIILHRYR